MFLLQFRTNKERQNTEFSVKTSDRHWKGSTVENLQILSWTCRTFLLRCRPMYMCFKFWKKYYSMDSDTCNRMASVQFLFFVWFVFIFSKWLFLYLIGWIKFCWRSLVQKLAIDFNSFCFLFDLNLMCVFVCVCVYVCGVWSVFLFVCIHVRVCVHAHTSICMM